MLVILSYASCTDHICNFLHLVGLLEPLFFFLVGNDLVEVGSIGCM